MVECALISSDETFRHLATGLVGEPAARARLVLDLSISSEDLTQERVRRVLEASPAVVFLDLGDFPAGMEGLRSLVQELPSLSYIVAGPELPADALLSVMRAGATEYLPRPLSRDEAVAAFWRVRRRSHSSEAQSGAGLGKVTAVMSAKGGTGVTTVATNLAVILRRLTEKETLLIDLVPGLGTAAIAMGLKARYTYLDVIQNFHRIDEDLLRSFLEPHDAGVSVLASPISPGDSEGVTVEQVQDLIRLCRGFFGNIVIDGGNSLTELFFATYLEADERLLIVTPEIPTLRNLKRAMDLLGPTNRGSPPRIVLNGYRDGVGLSVRDVRHGLGQEIGAILERDDQAISESVNLGRLAAVVGKSRFVRSLTALGGQLAGSDRVVAERRGFLDRFRRPHESRAVQGLRKAV